ncbi:MAG TPA: response regulator transcription factor [Anaerolineales bacterium]|nr:response regulator transcription factor [Anaerolineales bacterium]
MPIRLLVADDHGLLRAGLIALLNAETGMTVVGEADDEHSAVSLTVEKRPDIVLMDISMPDSGGIEATRRIKQLVPEAKILIMTVHEDKGLMQEAIRAGAMGYILKRAIKSELVNAIHAVMRDELYLHPAMARLLFVDNQSRQPQTVNVAPEPFEPLTSREIEVLRLIARGYTNNQIAEMLHISVRTVEYHRGNLTAKLNLRSRSELMRYAEEKGLI